MASVPSATRIAPETRVFHGGPPEAVSVRPVPGGIAISAGRDAGDFASIALDLPEAAPGAVTPRSIVALSGIAAASGRGTMEARINLRHGPNVARQVRPLRLTGQNAHMAEFDLAYTDLCHAPVRQIWLDLLIGAPDAAVLEVRDLALSFRPRAEF